MTDYTAEVEARLGKWVQHPTGLIERKALAADVRAALAEIERLQGRVAGEHFESVAWQNRAECLAAIGQARTQDEDTPEEIAEERITNLMRELDECKAKLVEMSAPTGDWTDEARARLRDLLYVLEAGHSVIEVGNAADIRAALGEIRRSREEARLNRAAAEKHYAYGEAQKERAEAAEAEAERLRGALGDACDRMERARFILTDGGPTPACNWAMLDTDTLRAALRGGGE